MRGFTGDHNRARKEATIDAKALLIKQTREAFADNDEMSVKAGTKGLTQETASWKPNERTRTIEEILHHLAWCKVWYCKQAFGDCDLPDNLSVGDLGATLDWLEVAQRHLEECLNSRSLEELAQPVPTKFHGSSAAHLFWILLMHDVWHTGQIKTIRRQYETRAAAG